MLLASAASEARMRLTAEDIIRSRVCVLFSAAVEAALEEEEEEERGDWRLVFCDPPSRFH